MQFCYPSPSFPLDWRRGATRDGAVLPRFASRLTLHCRGGSGSRPSCRRRLAQKYLSRSLSVRRGARRSSACLVSAAAKRGPITSRLFELSPLPRSCRRAVEDRDGDRTASSCFLRRALLLQRSFRFLLYFVSPWDEQRRTLRAMGANPVQLACHVTRTCTRQRYGHGVELSGMAGSLCRGSS